MLLTSNKFASPHISILASFLDRFSTVILTATVVVTLLLVLPVLLLPAPSQASQNPKGEVFDVQSRIDDVFESPIHGISLVVEARDGDILEQSDLHELLVNQSNLIAADESGDLAVAGLDAQSYLFSYYDSESARQVSGVTSLANAVDELLRQHPVLSTTLSEASDEQVKFAIHLLFSNPQTTGLRDDISVKATSETKVLFGEEITWWSAPALIFNVLADNEKLGGGALSINLTGDAATLNKEEFSRKVQDILRGNQVSFQLWAIAIDVNLESEEEGQQAGVFITLTAIIALAIVGIALRSYWSVALTSVGLAALIIWLKGISTLIGIKGGLINDLIVPIAMISLGVDFAVHAVRRYQEEKGLGNAPAAAFKVGITGVGGALILAFASDSIAFLSNTSSGIEAVVHFGFAAGVAVASAFIVLGLVVPLAVSRADQNTVELPLSAKLNGWLRILGGLGITIGAGSAIIIMIALSALIGLAVLSVVFILLIMAPYFIGKHVARSNKNESAVHENNQPPAPARVAEYIVESIVRYRLAVLVITIAITVIAFVMALRLDSTFDAEDFFSSDSDFVVSLDKTDEHLGERGGEPAVILISGNLADQSTIDAMALLYENLQTNETLARRSDGTIRFLPPDPLAIIRGNTESQVARQRALALTGVDIVDVDGDGMPDTNSGIRAALELAVAEGVYNGEGEVIYNPDRVATVYRRTEDTDFMRVTVGIPGTRQQSNVGEAYERLSSDVDPLAATSSIKSYGLTGSAFTRNEGLKATTSSLQKSIPIAAGVALIVLVFAMRSFRFAVVTVIPIGLVVIWLYGIMHVFGFDLNFVTATIGAVSIGVGIDYSIHMTERYREEMNRSILPVDAARKAARGTGMALIASAGSSIGGFVVMGFAPMPLFSSYGILTATMIALALTASILVLPALLTLVTRVNPVEKPVTESKTSFD